MCGATPLLLNAGSGYTTYAWSGGSNPSTQQNNVTTAGSYTVTVSNTTTGCTATASTTVANTSTPPTVVITPSGAITFCAGGMVDLVASGADTYVWAAASGTVSGANVTGVNASGTYTVTATNTTTGCTATTEVIVTVNTLPTVTVTGGGAVCTGGSLTLTANPTGTYSWSNAATSASITATAGTYTVTVTDSNGCSASASGTVTEDVAMCTAVADDTDIVPGTTCLTVATLTSTGSGNWLYATVAGRVVAAIKDDAVMGLIEVKVTQYNTTGSNTGSTGTPPQVTLIDPAYPATYNSGANGVELLDRRITILPATQPSNPVAVRLFMTNADVLDLINDDNDNDGNDILSVNDIRFTHISGDVCSGTSFGNTNTLIMPTVTAIGSNWQFQFMVASFSTFVGHGGSTPLPVTLKSFTGKVSGVDNVLDWTTASERNTAFFALERSIDGNDFRQIAQVAAVGNSTALNNYTNTDKNAPTYAYYRLRMVDVDGTYEFSNTVYLEHRKGGLTIDNVYPIPTDGLLMVEYQTELATTVRFTLTDALGQLVGVKTATTVSGQNRQQIDMSDLPAGVYFIQLDENGSKRTVRRVIKN